MTLSVVTEWQREASELVVLFRLGRNVEGGLQLADYFEKVLIGMQAHLSKDENRQLPQLLAAILACQERQDWIGLADYLEYELQQLFIELNDTV